MSRNILFDTLLHNLLFFNGLREVDLRCAGFGHHIPALLASDRLAQMCRGGSVKLAESLATVIEQNGGTIRCNCQIQSILVEGDRVVGVALDDGEHNP